MQLIIDLDLQQAVQAFGSRQPTIGIQCKSQDTPRLDIYFVQASNNVDLGTSPGLRFGVYVTGNPNNLIAAPTFSRNTDPTNKIRYSGFPNFDTSLMAAAIGSASELTAIAEVRYQATDGTIARTMDVPMTVIRSLLAETILDTTQTAFTVPAVASNVTVQISSTSWLHTGLNLTIGGGAGAYQVVSITDGTHFIAENQGGASNAAPGTVIPSGSTVGIAPAPVLPTYPDPSIIELTTHKGQPNGYASLDANTLLLASRVPVDGATIVATAGGKIASGYILATVAANFTTPAANAIVSVTLNSTTSLVAGMYVRIPVAGYYIVESITSGTVAVLQNNGDPFNAASGVTITTGAVLLPAQAATSGSGTPGQNAYTATLASFTVPAAGAAVSVNMGSTAWLSGSGYVVFIAGAGYYAVSSITDTTHALLTNLGYAVTNAAAGTNIASGAAVSPGGLQGVAGSGNAGANAYDTTSASFIMPAAGSSVNVAITNTNWLGVGQQVYIAGSGYFSVGSITSPTIFNATNSNYPGAAAPGGTIAAGARVSPAGVIGPQGAGGAGLNAFTSLSANFTQPAVNATVAIVVGSTAWMAVGQGIFITGGGYYSVSIIGDLTYVTVVNLGSSGNAAPGATIIGTGAQTISPAGTPGQTGISSYTTTTANFTMPAVGASVTIALATAAFIQQNQNIFVAGAGYFVIAALVDSTHVAANNLGASGNVSSGTVIAAGSGVTTAGAIGPTGATGPTGPSGGIGEAPADGQLYGRKSSAWAVVPSGGSGSGQPDPTTGLFITDDLFFGAGAGTPYGPYVGLTFGNGSQSNTSTYGVDNVKKVVGSYELQTGTNNTTGQGKELYHGWISSSAPYGNLPYGLGPLVWKTRIFIEGTLPPTGNSYIFRAGIAAPISLPAGHAGGSLPGFMQGFAFAYSPDQNSGQWQVYVGTTTPTATNTSVAVAGDTAYWLECDINAAWTSFTFYINGSLVATVTTGLPTGSGNAFWNLLRGGGTGANYQALIDAWYLNYQFTR